MWGPNVFSESGEQWKKHRKILQPAFGPRTYALVCAETWKLYDEMVAVEGWAGKEVLELPVVNRITHNVRSFTQCDGSSGLVN